MADYSKLIEYEIVEKAKRAFPINKETTVTWVSSPTWIVVFGNTWQRETIELNYAVKIVFPDKDKFYRVGYGPLSNTLAIFDDA